MTVPALAAEGSPVRPAVEGTGDLKTVLVPVGEVKVGVRHRKDLGDLRDLQANMSRLGLLQAIGINRKKQLLFGQRRLEAALALGWLTIPARIFDIDSMLDAEHAENEHRKDLTDSEKVALGKALEEEQKERRGRNNPNNPSEDKGKETADVVAKKAGFGNGESYRQAKKVVEAGTPALVEAMDAGTVSKVDAAEVAKEPPAVQDALVAEGPEAVKEAAAANRQLRRKPRKPAVEPKDGDALKVRSFTQAMVDVRKCLEGHGAFALEPKVVDGALHLPAENPRLALIVAVFKVDNLAKLIEEGKLTLKIAK